MDRPSPTDDTIIPRAPPEIGTGRTAGRYRPYRGRSALAAVGISLVAVTVVLTVFQALPALAAPFGPGVPTPSPGATPGSPDSLSVPLANDSTGVGATASSDPLAVSISASAVYALGPLKTTFTSTVKGGSGSYSYDWQFGDNTGGTVADPTHTYSTPGTYLVTLTVKDPAGKSGSAEAFVTSATSGSGTLTVHSSLGTVPSTFWGYNLDYETGSSGFDNATLAGYVEKTPIVYIRLPISGDGYSYPGPWEALAKFCKMIDCQEIATVGGPGVTAAEAVKAMERAVSDGIDPAYWAFGNEPDLWFAAGYPTSGLQYAELVKTWITLAKPLFPDAKFIGAEITGHAKFGNAYIYNVTKIDGSLINAIAIQLYPQFGYGTVSGFLRSLTVANSIGVGIPRIQALMKSACPSCSVPILLDEFQGGSGYNAKYAPMRAGFPDATFFAASIVQAFNVHLQQFAPWTLAGVPTSLQSHPGNCEMGLIHLNSECTGAILSPTYYLYSNLLSRFPYGKLSNVTDTSSSEVYAVQVKNGTHTVVLVVNANPSSTETLTLGSGFPTSGSLTTYLMDLQHVATPLTATSTLSSGSSAKVVVPPLGIMLLSFTPSGSGSPAQAHPGGLALAPGLSALAYVAKGLPRELVPTGWEALAIAYSVGLGFLFLSVAARREVAPAKPGRVPDPSGDEAVD